MTHKFYLMKRWNLGLPQITDCSCRTEKARFFPWPIQLNWIVSGVEMTFFMILMTASFTLAPPIRLRDYIFTRTVLRTQLAIFIQISEKLIRWLPVGKSKNVMTQIIVTSRAIPAGAFLLLLNLFFAISHVCQKCIPRDLYPYLYLFLLYI